MNDSSPHTPGPIATDIPPQSWIDRLAPSFAKPYLRLARADRPIGTWLLLLPCWWGLALATPTWPDWQVMILFAVGSIVMRGAGCTVNDIADRNFDARVARTATRPIASGKISVAKAVLFLGLQLLLGLAVLVQFNMFSIILGISSLALVAAYPFMKRITYWPQLFLGLTFNWGALVGWSVVTGSLAAPALALYGAGIFWTLGYDTIYAHQDKEDDALIGVKSTALKFGAATKPWLAGFYTITLGLLISAGWLAGLGWPFYAALGLAALHLAWQTQNVDITEPKDCLSKFKSNRDFGLMVFVGIVAGQLLV
ncbi:MAG: 4-hydroxybenzoate octaprenyltransferase [Proteobacteria bacterium]|nr:4-hydroxybenzoate octaprenyltransferase [Pseudomonadota bacterium]MDA1022505.1 4-hydroxybenzoate octaprenyltransferase [Pseudomonadota bacterium]